MSSVPAIQNSTSHAGARHVWRARIAKMAASLAVLYSLTLGGFYYAMKQPPENFARVMMARWPGAISAVSFRNHVETRARR